MSFIVIITEDGGTGLVTRAQGLALPLAPVAPCHGRHADTLSAPLSVAGQPNGHPDHHRS